MPFNEPFGFAKARKKARQYANDKERSSELLGNVLQKAVKHQVQLKGILRDLLLLYRMLKAWTTGEYKAMPWKTIVLGLTAVIYFLNPLDLVPDFIPGIGYLDDAVVLGFVMNSIRKDVSRYQEWQNQRESKVNLQ
jgi:uncharacterized membrane protein YkvA (DUF1232 family)